MTAGYNRCFGNDKMKSLAPALAAALLTLSIAGCATAPPPPQAVIYPDAPPRKQLDAKTQLETGRRY